MCVCVFECGLYLCLHRVNVCYRESSGKGDGWGGGGGGGGGVEVLASRACVLHCTYHIMRLVVP